MHTQEEIYIEDDVIKVFQKKSIDDVTITDKKLKLDNSNKKMKIMLFNRRYIKKNRYKLRKINLR